MAVMAGGGEGGEGGGHMRPFDYSMPTTQHIYVPYIRANVRCELTPSRVSHTKFA